MTQRDESDSLRAAIQEARNLHHIRVELPLRTQVIDVIPCCGPDGKSIMVDWYDLTHVMYISAGAAVALAEALVKAATTTTEVTG